MRIEAPFAELRECRRLHDAVIEDTGRLMDAVLAEVFTDLASNHELIEAQEVCNSITDGNHTTPPYVESGTRGRKNFRVCSAHSKITFFSRGDFSS